jgi:hypothetical protein
MIFYKLLCPPVEKKCVWRCFAFNLIIIASVNGKEHTALEVSAISGTKEKNNIDPISPFALCSPPRVNFYLSKAYTSLSSNPTRILQIIFWYYYTNIPKEVKIKCAFKLFFSKIRSQDETKKYVLPYIDATLSVCPDGEAFDREDLQVKRCAR